MALPRSTFVMGVVTLGLFGIAIYETAGKKGGHERKHLEDEDDGYDGEEEIDREEALAEYHRAEADRAKREAESRLAKAKALEAKKAELGKLFAAEVALPGVLFRGVVLDSKEVTDSTFENRRETFIAATDSSVTTGTGNKFDRFEIRPGSRSDSEDRYALCVELENALRNAWGSPYADDDGVRLWTNKLAGIRASFQGTNECLLVFERFDEPAAWLNKSGTSTVPYGWIGKPAKLVEDAVGAAPNGEVIEWLAHGVGAGGEQTTIQAFVENGKVSHVIATTTASTPTRAALEEHLRAEFGKPKVQDRGSDDLRLEWPAKNLVVVMSDNGSIAVMNRKP